MSDHNEHACGWCGSLLHREDDCDATSMLRRWHGLQRSWDELSSDGSSASLRREATPSPEPDAPISRSRVESEARMHPTAARAHDDGSSPEQAADAAALPPKKQTPDRRQPDTMHNTKTTRARRSVLARFKQLLATPEARARTLAMFDAVAVRTAAYLRLLRAELRTTENAIAADAFERAAAPFREDDDDDVDAPFGYDNDDDAVNFTTHAWSQWRGRTLCGLMGHEASGPGDVAFGALRIASGTDGVTCGCCKQEIRRLSSFADAAVRVADCGSPKECSPAQYSAGEPGEALEPDERIGGRKQGPA